MATQQIIQKGITFTISDEPVFIYGNKKIANSSAVNLDGQYNITKVNTKITNDSDSIGYPVVNAIDIDWNGATIVNQGSSTGNTIFNTTGDLISYIGIIKGLVDLKISLPRQSVDYGNDYGSNNQVLLSNGDRTFKWGNLPSSLSYTAGGGLTLTGNVFSLNEAAWNVLGGIKLGYTDSITNSKNYAVQVNLENQAFVEVPWTEITAEAIDNSENDNSKSLTVKDNNNLTKFLIKLATTLAPGGSVDNNDTVAIIELRDSENHLISTYLPSFKIDGNNRKITYRGATGLEVGNSITFGNLDIIAVLEQSPNYDSTDGDSITMDFNNSASGTKLNKPIHIGDLILAYESESAEATNHNYHLWVCYESNYVEPAVGETAQNAEAYLKDLGVFPGNNVSVLYYEVVDNVATLPDN